jgi:putative ABC transport system permease protein
MVTNLAHLERASHGAGPNVVFAKASGDPASVAQRVRQATRRDGTVVKDINGQTAQTVSSITTVNLDDISRIEELFSVVLAAGAMALFVALAVAERGQEFATMAAVGASLRRVGAFLWSEAGFVLAAGALLATALGLLLAKMLVAMLTHAFDPPPDHLAIPWAFLGELSAATLLSTVIAIAIAARRLRRLPLGAILREQ